MTPPAIKTTRRKIAIGDWVTLTWGRILRESCTGQITDLQGRSVYLGGGVWTRGETPGLKIKILPASPDEMAKAYRALGGLTFCRCSLRRIVGGGKGRGK